MPPWMRIRIGVRTVDTTMSTEPRGLAGIWQRNPERVAWVIMLLSFFLCIALAVGVPAGARAFVLHSTRGLDVAAQSLWGTALLELPGRPELTALTKSHDLDPGMTVRTDEASSAIITVYAETLPPMQREVASILMYPNTEVRLQRARFPRFPRWSPDPGRLSVWVDQGRVRVVSGRFPDRPLITTVETPHGRVQAADASFSVFVSNRGMDVTVRQGNVRVEARGLAVTVEEGQRTWVPLAQPPQTPTSAERNLVRNGNFTEPLEVAWDVGFLQPDVVASGTVSVVDVGGRRAVRFSRRAEEGVHTEVWIEQKLEQDVRDVDTLILRMDVRLLYQSLPGGGMMGSEYPLMVRIDYTDVYGKDQFWVHGFYFRDPTIRGWPLVNGEKIPPYVWWPYESPNLVALWEQGGTRPAVLHSIRIYASGHNYESMVAEVGLFAK